MAKKQIRVKITNKKEIEKLNQEFEENRKKIAKKVYSSITEERLRTNKIIISKKLKAPLEKVFEVVCLKATKDMHPDLNFNDLQEDTFYRSSGKSNKIPFKIISLKVNKELGIEFFAKDQHFIKTLRFHGNKKNTSTKITYIDVASGKVSIQGWYERHLQSIYVKKQTIAFRLQILNAQLDLGLINQDKIEKTKKQIAKMLEQSKKIY